MNGDIIAPNFLESTTIHSVHSNENNKYIILKIIVNNNISYNLKSINIRLGTIKSQ